MTDEKSLVKVLLIEDNPGDARLVEMMLAEAETAGGSPLRFAAERAERLARGLELLANGSFDVILLDLSLPDSQGFATFNAVRSKYPNAPCVLLTGLDDTELAARAVQLGAQDYLVKGHFDASLLSRAIRHAIERHRLRLSLQRATEELAASEARLRAIIENNADGMVIVDGRGTVRFANPAAQTLLGRSESELLGLALGFPVAGDHEVSEIEMVRADAKKLTVELRLADIEWENQPMRLLSLRDVTLRKYLEAQLLESRKMETVGRLAGGIAHEFNNLLTAVIGYASFAQETISPDEPAYRDIDVVLQCAQKAADLTRQILTFSRHQGDMSKAYAIDLSKLIADIEGMLRQAAGDEVTFVTQFAPDLGRFRADPGQIEQALVHLVLNARDAMPDGGLLTIEARNVTVDLDHPHQNRVADPKPYVVLTVKDTGIGMTPEILSHIFEPFYTTKKVGEGSGLGLAIVYGVVKRFGGEIRARSESGQGSEFALYFPRIHYEREVGRR